MNSINADLFLQTLFPFDLLNPDERPVVAYPDTFVSRETGETVSYYRQMHYRPGVIDPGRAWYACVSTVVAQRQRQVRKRLEDVRTAMVLVVDDVGTKSKEPPFGSSYVLETSEGNYQWGWLIEPFDVSGSGAVMYDRILMSLAAGGFNDPGFRGATRLVRVPGSVHKSGFEARIVEWHPEAVFELVDIFEAFDVPLLAGGRGAGRRREPGVVSVVDNCVDPLYRWLVAQGLVKGHNDDFVFLDCPWRAGHTGGLQGPTSTGFSPWGYGRYMDRSFKCLHGHCSGVGVRQFEEWARSKGAVIDLEITLNGSRLYVD